MTEWCAYKIESYSSKMKEARQVNSMQVGCAPNDSERATRKYRQEVFRLYHIFHRYANAVSRSQRNLPFIWVCQVYAIRFPLVLHIASEIDFCCLEQYRPWLERVSSRKMKNNWQIMLDFIKMQFRKTMYTFAS